MISVSYTITPQLKEILQSLSEVYQRHCITPIAPKTERLFRYQAIHEHILLLAELLAIELNAKEKQKFFTPTALSPAKQLLANYRQVLTLIQDEQAGEPAPTEKTIEDWATTLYIKTNRPSPLSDISLSGIKQLCSYIATEHPVIAAALAYAQWTIWEPYAPVSCLGILHSYSYLARSGYDARGQLIFPMIFQYRSTLSLVQKSKDTPDLYSTTAGVTYKDALAQIQAQSGSNWWLLFFAEALHNLYQTLLAKQTQYANQEIKTPKTRHQGKLSPRQRAILDLLDRPDATINNRFVQKKFRVSQITASRELSSLVSMGYLLQQGRSRSIHYTKI